MRLPINPGKLIYGFTLAELLISLAILGVIATITIPIIIQSQSNGTHTAIGRETLGMISAAYQQYQQSNSVSASTTGGDLTPFMNYVSYDLSGTQLDNLYTLSGGANCNTVGNQRGCMVLHNGARLSVFSMSFGGTANNNAIVFHLDPDGIKTDSTTNGPGKTVEIELFYNGRISSRGQMGVNAVSSDVTRSAAPVYDPPWFQ